MLVGGTSDPAKIPSNIFIFLSDMYNIINASTYITMVTHPHHIIYRKSIPFLSDNLHESSDGSPPDTRSHMPSL